MRALHSLHCKFLTLLYVYGLGLLRAMGWEAVRLRTCSQSFPWIWLVKFSWLDAQFRHWKMVMQVSTMTLNWRRGMDELLLRSLHLSVYNMHIEPKCRWRCFGRYHIKDENFGILVRETPRNGKHALRAHHALRNRDTSKDKPEIRNPEFKKKESRYMKWNRFRTLNLPGYKWDHILDRNRPLLCGIGCTFFHLNLVPQVRVH